MIAPRKSLRVRVFLLAILETSFVTGLIAPSGVATSIATGIALEEGSSVLPVVLAALAGGAIGDNVGFWIGRSWRERWVSGSGRFARRVRDIQMRSDPYLSGRPFISVTVARMISFVRTVMPMAAGMSALPYVRYLPYELLGGSLGFAYPSGSETSLNYGGNLEVAPAHDGYPLGRLIVGGGREGGQDRHGEHGHADTSHRSPSCCSRRCGEGRR